VSYYVNIYFFNRVQLCVLGLSARVHLLTHQMGSKGYDGVPRNQWPAYRNLTGFLLVPPHCSRDTKGIRELNIMDIVHTYATQGLFDTAPLHIRRYYLWERKKFAPYADAWEFPVEITVAAGCAKKESANIIQNLRTAYILFLFFSPPIHHLYNPSPRYHSHVLTHQV
jgi:hypothetical protein